MQTVPVANADRDVRYFRTSEVSLISGMSLRVLQWMDEQGGLVKPVLQGHTRLWAPWQVLGCCVIAQLKRKGYSNQQIRRMWRDLRAEQIAHGDYLLAGGKHFAITEDPVEFIRSHNGRSGWVLVDLVELRRRIRRHIAGAEHHA